MENAREDFKNFWELIGAEGDLDAALAEWGNFYNASDPALASATPRRAPRGSLLSRLARRVSRVVGNSRAS